MDQNTTTPWAIRGNAPPSLDFELEVRTQRAVLECVRQGLLTACHDVSKGGLGIALAEMAVAGGNGASVDCGLATTREMGDHELLFSESNSRFILTTNQPSQVLQVLSNSNVPAAITGKVGGSRLQMTLGSAKLDLELDELRSTYLESLGEVLEPWQK